MKILVTGCAGFIGSHLSQTLLCRGDKILGIDNLNDYYEVNKKLGNLHILKQYENFNFIEKDILDRKFIKSIIHRFDYIIPLAALVGAPLCEKFKKKAVDTNLNAIKFLLKRAIYKFNNIPMVLSPLYYGLNDEGKKIVNFLFKKLYSNTNNNFSIQNFDQNKSRSVADFISGMTDRYAINLYEELK